MIWIVVPTIREDSFNMFKDKWSYLFVKHSVTLVTVKDGEKPTLECTDCSGEEEGNTYTPNMPQTFIRETKLLYNFSDCVRNLGFYFVAFYGKQGDVIITLDDDCYPNGNDPIQEHLDILGTKHPISWVSSADEYMRGFPYGIREEAEVLVSHGVWANVPDLDAPTQLVKGVKNEYIFKKGVIPKGIYFPFCIMNVAFKYEALPYMYQAPAGPNCPDQIDRFADIWCGINLVRYAQEHNFAIATGYSSIWHDRASNVFENLKKESKGLPYNEYYWEKSDDEMGTEYFTNYNEKRNLWVNEMKNITERK